MFATKYLVFGNQRNFRSVLGNSAAFSQHHHKEGSGEVHFSFQARLET